MAIIQARMGSVRFPGKMLARLGEIPVLEWVITRLLCSTLLDEVVLATSNNEPDDALINLASKNGIITFRGSEDDVLSRFIGAAKFVAADSIVRICADNPFVDPREVDKLITYFHSSDLDYCCNHQDRLGSLYADGFGAEIISINVLEEIEKNASHLDHREHITKYLWDHAENYKLGSILADAKLAFPSLRFDVDTQTDLDWLSSLIARGVTIQSPAEEIINIALHGR